MMQDLCACAKHILQKPKTACLNCKSPWGVPWSCAWTIGVIDSERSAVVLLTSQDLHGLHCTLNIDKVGMGKTSGLTRPSINSDSDIDDIADASEKVVQVSVGHLEGHVANEQSLARWVDRLVLITVWSCSFLALIMVGKRDHQSSTLKELLVELIDCLLSLLGTRILNVSETMKVSCHTQ